MAENKFKTSRRSLILLSKFESGNLLALAVLMPLEEELQKSAKIKALVTANEHFLTQKKQLFYIALHPLEKYLFCLISRPSGILL